MDLILWRHADAEDGVPGKPDAARRLTARGERDARRVARWLRRRLPAEARVLASPAQRAQQTARAFRRGFETDASLGTAAGARALLEAAGWPHAGGVVVVVGHQPTLGEALALAVTGRPLGWSVKKGALWWIEHRGEGDVVVRAVIAPDLV